jgi:hypothetical protein
MRNRIWMGKSKLKRRERSMSTRIGIRMKREQE